MRVRKTVEGKFMVINEYDGKCLHGPFETEREAVFAMAPKAEKESLPVAKPKKAKKKKK